MAKRMFAKIFGAVASAKVGARLTQAAVALIGLAALSAHPAEAKRVALVVGINAYENLSPGQQLHNTEEPRIAHGNASAVCCCT